jgi:hypothetical protein
MSTFFLLTQKEVCKTPRLRYNPRRHNPALISVSAFQPENSMNCKLLFAAAIVAFAITGSAFAQDTVQIHVGLSNLNVANTNFPGATGSVDIALARFGKWRAGVFGEFSYFDDTDDLLNRQQTLGGLSLARRFGADGRLAIGGQAVIGNTKFDSKTMVADFDRLTIGANGFVDVGLTDTFAVRLRGGAQYIDGRPVRYTTLTAGVVINLFGK